MREIFGDPAGRRLGGAGSAPSILERPEPAVIIQEAADLSRQVQLRLLALFSSRQAEDKFWIFETSRDLERMVGEGAFEQGLYRILEKGRVILPPLRVCRDFIPNEAERILEDLRRRHFRNVSLGGEAVEALLNYDWPGNWREMRWALESAFFTCSNGEISRDDLRLGAWSRREDFDDLNLRRRSEELEKSLILRAYALHGGNQVQMARALGISRGSLQYKMDKYQLFH